MANARLLHGEHFFESDGETSYLTLVCTCVHRSHFQAVVISFSSITFWCWKAYGHEFLEVSHRNVAARWSSQVLGSSSRPTPRPPLPFGLLCLILSMPCCTILVAWIIDTTTQCTFFQSICFGRSVRACSAFVLVQHVCANSASFTTAPHPKRSTLCDSSPGFFL
jgi:hypothetical protein